MYHDLVRGKTRDEIKDSYTLAEADFRAHMEHLSSNGYMPVLAEDYCRCLRDPRARLPDKCVLITFDDGHESNLTIAVPILREFDFKASFFITTGRTGTPGYMNQAQLRELKKAGMSVQSHAKTHLFLSELSEADMARELVESKKVLEDILRAEVPFLSFPGGRYNRAALEHARQAGYQACFSSIPFYLKRLDGLFLIGRCAVRYASGSTTFEKVLDLSFLGRSALAAACHGKDFLKKVLGNDAYYTLWKKYISR